MVFQPISIVNSFISYRNKQLEIKNTVITIASFHRGKKGEILNIDVWYSLKFATLFRNAVNISNINLSTKEAKIFNIKEPWQ